MNVPKVKKALRSVARNTAKAIGIPDRRKAPKKTAPKKPAPKPKVSYKSSPKPSVNKIKPKTVKLGRASVQPPKAPKNNPASSIVNKQLKAKAKKVAVTKGRAMVKRTGGTFTPLVGRLASKPKVAKKMPRTALYKKPK